MTVNFDLGLVGVILGAASLVLHYIAPKTKTKVDDKAAEVVDKAKEVLPMVAPLLPKAGPAAPTEVAGFKADGGVRDHRG